MIASVMPPEDPRYPSSDGKPLAESDWHRDWMARLIQLLSYSFAGQRVYVSGNLLVYYEEGKPKRRVAPDVFAVKGVDPGLRRIYKIWEEGKPPDFVLETTSKKTRHEDVKKKMPLYAQLGIPEYFLYDPMGEWLDPPFRGYRLVNGEYVRLEPDATGGIASEQLGITFRLQNGQLELYDSATGELLRPAKERAAEAEARAAKETKARQALEEELARLRAERDK